ncbi:hypothetical protein MKUB_05930 [Mycobacterium kubicae]|uniref:Uncharacterized protein n=1 Tax=Mycobacterium kubicae TaxID=120959 RepID=A0ABQ1BHC8_9MYCO|nr:hypothetical protein MKUB_05930 [Mycobacterium kubicae]
MVIRSVPGGALDDGDVVGWPLFWLVHALNGVMAVRTATAQAAPFFMRRSYPESPICKLRLTRAGLSPRLAALH